MKNRRVEWTVLFVLLILAVGVLAFSFAPAKTEPLYDLLSKLGFAILVTVVVRALTILFSISDRKREVRLQGFDDLGMMVVHDPLSDFRVRDLLANAKRIRVLKTWFPENSDIEAGLMSALKRKASMELILCHPNSKLLHARCVGAEEAGDHGGRRVIRALRMIHDAICPAGSANPAALPDNLDIRLYDTWPGCPIIWYDGTWLMGFYFRGASSPKWPWIEVREGSKLAEILDDQFSSTKKDPSTTRIRNCAELLQYKMNGTGA
ncbi:MAG: hypothetical protein HOP28_05850 [Gemmatimonadales bacterium]|nr:hypothetical protein [Gemmatimonadales bacterium]